MCDCFLNIPRPARTKLLYELQRTPWVGIYEACFRIEADLGRTVYHQLLRWADSLAECHECRPRLRGLPFAA
ncbi:MAG: hypothetical protein ACM31L_18110 [Actinomycetota bacterium]